MKYTRLLLVAIMLGASTLTIAGCGASKVLSPDNPIESAPPAAPTSVSMTTEDATSRDYLNWNASASSDVVSYEIFRFADGTVTTDGELVGTIASDQVSFLLPLVGSSVTEYYRVRAVNSNDITSAYSTNCDAERTAWTGGGGQIDDPNKGKDDLN
ncbi:MAG: hypothetical protein ABIU54_04415 [Candidatus Eisenbacteria bacterium]